MSRRDRWCFAWPASTEPPTALTRAAALLSTRWPVGAVVSVSFLDGEPALHRRVEEAALAWTRQGGDDGMADLVLDFRRDTRDTRVRISFRPGGSWCTLGTTCRHLPADAPTLNLAGLTADTPDDELRGLVLHEIGHVLGLVHEHPRPEGGVQWNRRRVLADLAAHGFSAAEAELNLFQPWAQAETNFGEVHAASVMACPLPAAWSEDGFARHLNPDLSSVTAPSCAASTRRTEARTRPTGGPGTVGAVGTACTTGGRRRMIAGYPPNATMADPRSFTELGHFEIDPRSVRLLDQEFCRDRQVVVLGVVPAQGDDPVTVGMVEPRRRSRVREVEERLGRPVEPVQLNAFEVRRALDHGWGLGDPAHDPGVLDLGPVADLSFREDSASRLVQEILGRAVQLGASDVHVETYEHDVDVRYRVDGVLRQVPSPLSLDNVGEAIARLKVLAGLDIAERRRAQDGRIRATWRHRGEERPIDLRLSVVPGPAGEDAVLRILDRATAVRGLEELGFGGEDLATFEGLITNPEGMVLVTGPTGSGKTTTLYAALERINTDGNKILTAEDPVEYRFPKTNQKQVSSTMGFADYARAFLRQNPDVLLIGEIRDEETADAAVRAAQTGHLVLSTLHTGDAVRTVSRLLTLGVEPAMIAGILLGAVSQRLVRRVCSDCREEVAPSGEEVRRLGVAADETFHRGRGCEACDGRGLRGRTGIYELFVLDPETADRVAAGEPVHELRRRARAGGMTSLLDDALTKARSGVIPLSEVLRAVPYRMIETSRDKAI